MKKITLFLCFICAALYNCAQNDSGTTNKTNSSNATDSSRYISKKRELDLQLQEALIKKLTEKEESHVIDWLVPLIVSAVFGVSAFVFSQRSMRRDKKYRDLAFVAEVDKLLIEHPELRGYDEDYFADGDTPLTIAPPVKLIIKGKKKFTITGVHSFTAKATGDNPIKITIDDKTKETSLSDMTSFTNVEKDTEYNIENDAEINISQCSNVIITPSTDNLTNAKIRSFCYYLLNNFELALMHHHNDESIIPWENYLTHTYNKSNQFKRLVEYAQSIEGKKIFSVEFVQRLDELFPENKKTDR